MFKVYSWYLWCHSHWLKLSSTYLLNKFLFNFLNIYFKNLVLIDIDKKSYIVLTLTCIEIERKKNWKIKTLYLHLHMNFNILIHLFVKCVRDFIFFVFSIFFTFSILFVLNVSNNQQQC